MIHEDLLQYIWRTGLFDQARLTTTSGEAVQVIKRGHLNTDAGPDFTHARIRIGEADWVGHVEIHVRASEWYKHKHHLDPAYNNTVLHAVYENDKEALREDGTVVPCIIFKDRLDELVLQNYEALQQYEGWIACAGLLPQIDGFTKYMMIERACVSRLEEKSKAVKILLSSCSNDWQSAFYITLARNFGFSVNAEAFEMLAHALPLQVLTKHKHELLQTEALLFGTAGFLESKDNTDEYSGSLKTEFDFLAHKYGLKPMPAHLWKHMRMRPANFPELRLAQFAALVHVSTHLFAKVLESKTIEELRSLFDVQVSPYWQQHYRFATISAGHSGNMSASSVDLLLINTVVPFLFCYGTYMDQPEYRERALSLLQSIKPEDNSIISQWASLNTKAQNAFDTQALLHQKKHFCDTKRCLSCAVGNKILQAKK